MTPALACLALLLALPATAAEAPRPVPGGAPGDPPAEAVRFDDWRLDCSAACVAETVVRGGGGAGPVVLRLRLDRPVDPEAMVVETPLPLFLPDGVTVGIGAAEPRHLPWHTCAATGCRALLALDPGLLARLRGERAATVAFTLLDGTRVRLDASLGGFTAAERAARDAASDAPAAAADGSTR
jgi:invasion protein IalB